jgi:hypothetical protein
MYDLPWFFSLFGVKYESPLVKSISDFYSKNDKTDRLFFVVIFF